MYPRLARLRLREAALHSAPLREPFLPLLAPLHAALPCGGGGRRSIARYARASGGQGYFQHYSGTEPLNFIQVIKICDYIHNLNLLQFAKQIRQLQTHSVTQ